MLLRWNQKHFSSFLKGFQLPKKFSDLKILFKEEIDVFSVINRDVDDMTKDPITVIIGLTVIISLTVIIMFS